MTVEVADLIGVPYKAGGRDLSGLDCYGLAILYYKRMGKNLIDVQYEDHDVRLAQEYAPLLNVKKVDYICSDVLLEMHCGNELHIGIALNSKLFIHATRNQGVRISQIGSIPIIAKYEVI